MAVLKTSSLASRTLTDRAECRIIVVNPNPVGNRLAGDGDSKDVIAGKPVSYGSAVNAEL
jgi:hypothetical protein